MLTTNLFASETERTLYLTKSRESSPYIEPLTASSSSSKKSFSSRSIFKHPVGLFKDRFFIPIALSQSVHSAERKNSIWSVDITSDLAPETPSVRPVPVIEICRRAFKTVRSMTALVQFEQVNCEWQISLSKRLKDHINNFLEIYRSVAKDRPEVVDREKQKKVRDKATKLPCGHRECKLYCVYIKKANFKRRAGRSIVKSSLPKPGPGMTS